jgi:PP-loop superfamily ATP-utilizing enzyme
LLFDRADKTITLCEIKYHQSEYAIVKNDPQSISNKKEELRKFLTTKRTYRNMNVAFITVYGIQKNSCFDELQPVVVVLDDLISFRFIVNLHFSKIYKFPQ